MNIMDGLGLNQWLHGDAADQFELRLDDCIEDSFPASDPPSFSRSSSAHGRSRSTIAKWFHRNGQDANVLH